MYRILAVSAFAAGAQAQVITTGWTIFDPYERWTWSAPTETSILMEETAQSGTVGPGWVVSDFSLGATATIDFTLRIESAGDDDIVGFAFCRSDDTHGYLLDWKRAAQSYNWNDEVVVNDDLAERGLKIKKIDGAFTRDGLWGGTDGIGVSTIAGPIDRAWERNVNYTFRIELSPGRIVVELDGEPIFDVVDASFAGGRIATYGFSQDLLRYSNIVVTGLGCPADINGDGNLNIFDFLAFQTAFSNQEPEGDFNGDGQFNVFDFLAFQTAFGDGCA